MWLWVLGFVCAFIIVFGATSGAGKSSIRPGSVVGIVGRMGSGKSYFAVRMAYNLLKTGGADVASNFTMRLDQAGVKGEHTLLCGEDVWDQIATLQGKLNEDGRTRRPLVVIIDEAHNVAPASQSFKFPVAARWKLSMGRKFGIAVVWISQHEDRVNKTIRDLTNAIYVCNAWFDHLAFSAKGYEPEKMRRKDQHIDRKFYFFKSRIAAMYDTLEVLEIDDHLLDDQAQRAVAVGRAYNASRQAARSRGPERSEDRSGRASRRAAPKAAPKPVPASVGGGSREAEGQRSGALDAPDTASPVTLDPEPRQGLMAAGELITHRAPVPGLPF